jgi:UDP-N-acetylmuramoyl-L-alanyl-D-glutamate--2,6-diaminopimelate ligase
MLNNLTFKRVDWKVQESTGDSLLFYRIGVGEKAELDFFDRIKTAKYKHLIVNLDLPNLPANTTILPESKWPETQKEACDQVYPMPALKLIALTGTNGKTTTTDLVLQLGEQAGFRGFSIGTLGVRTLGKTLNDFGLTSPSFIDLRKFLFEYGSDKDFCVMEASSHALIQNRLYGLVFDSAGFLSFSQDHLDYHQNMEAYFDAKCLLFEQLSPAGHIFVPSEQDSLFHKLLTVNSRVKKAREIEGELPLFFHPKFNRNNLMVAASIIDEVFKVKITDFSKLTSPDGRFFIRPHKSSYIVVDFAHTSDALENICQGIRESFPSHKLKVLFGCGGDRDRAKRPLMGAVAARFSETVYLTSDNPRSEDPAQIIEDIARGIPSGKFQKITERPAAVQKAFGELGENEVLLLAGKGHEDYILRNGVKTHYSDIEEVEKFLGRKS